jgi:tRNA(Ile)-lysidine synthase
LSTNQFSPHRHLLQAFEQSLQLLPATQSLLIAFSGGMDSHVLLTLTHELLRDRFHIRAAHINHGLNSQANSWELLCEKRCKELNIPCEIARVDARPLAGESTEALAREKRYAALKELLQPGEVLLTAHHLDDQAETILLQLFRGSGINGLASMPQIMPFGAGHLFRPLLEIGRSELLKYAKSKSLQWVDDDSNQDVQFDRNFLRHSILPLIQKRWRSANQTLARSARHCASAATLLREVAQTDLKQVQNYNGTIQIPLLLTLTVERQHNVLRQWLHDLHLPLPNEKHLRHLIQDVLHCREDATPLVAWEGVEIRRHRDALYAMSPLQAHDENTILPWNILNDLVLPNHLGRITCTQILGKGIHAAMFNPERDISVRFRHGGEVFHPQGRSGSHPLKKLFQEWDVAPWLRDRTPLLYVGDECVAVVGYAIAKKYLAGENELGWRVELIPVAGEVK